MNTTLIILLAYLVLMLGIAWFFSRKESLGGYFLNKRKTSLWFMTFSTAATIIGAGAVVSVVSEVYNSGISYGMVLPISFVFGLIILGIMAKKIKAVGDKYEAYTLVDFFHKRFDLKNKILSGIIQLFLLVVWVAIQAIAIASLASVLIGVNYQTALFLAAAVTILYTTIGGLKIDIITDFIQFWIIFLMFIVMAFIGYNQVGGISNLLSNLPAGHLNPFAFGGVVWAVGGILLAGFLYLGNSSRWQLIFSAENQETAKKSFFLAIPFVVLIGIFALFFGLVAAVLLSEIKQDTAIFSLMYGILPTWLVGAGFAAILAVIMSSVDSLLIGGSTIIYKEIFKRKELSNKKELFYARLITALFGILGFFVAFMVPNIVTLTLFVTYLAIAFAPPIFAGLYSKKISANASFYSLLIPFLILVTLFTVIGKNIFVLTGLSGILIILFYDKIFRRKTNSRLKSSF